MKNALIADTGFWYALFDEKDRFHSQAITALAKYEMTLITTWPVVTETCYLLIKRQHIHVVNQFLELGKQKRFIIFQLAQADLSHANSLMRQYQNLPMDLADASLVILAEKLGHGRILSTDQRDFQSYRWKNHHPFENLLIP